MKIEIRKSELRKQIKERNCIVVIVRNGTLNHFFKESYYYIASQYGWDCDVWFFPEENVIITKGYRPIGSKLPIEIEEKFKNGGDINDFLKEIKSRS
jgi:hypothetical protein